MKYFYKGDIIASKKDTDLKWAITSGQVFIVISSIRNVESYMLLHRPFKNVIKHLFAVFYYDFLMTTK